MFWTAKPDNKKGQDAENFALAFLQEQGMILRKRNYACKSGELDLIMQSREILVFVEVRYRKNSRYGTAAESVDLRKQKRLKCAAMHYMQTFNLTGRHPCRFDIITIQPDTCHKNALSVDWIKDALGA